jgi:predicted DNA binding protein
MRKLTVELELKDEFKKNLEFLLEKTESIELIELIKLDFKKRIKMGIAALTMKEGYSIEDINIPDYMEMMAVLKKEGNKYIIVSKVKFLKNFISLAKKFDIDIIWDTPSIFTKDKLTMSVCGTEENLKKFLGLVKLIGDIKNVSFKKATFDEHSILSCLTQKQKEVLIAAKKNGYYNYPRKINSLELSKRIGLSKPTVVQHLRKAEERIIISLLAGY